MEILKENIENTLRASPKNIQLMDFLSIQELVVVVDIFYEVLSKEDKNLNQGKDFSNWQQRTFQNSVKELRDAQPFFGIKDLADKIDVKGFFDSFYSTYYKF